MGRGCDSRAVVVRLQEKFIDRNDVYILGVSCKKRGVVDDPKLAKKLAGKKAKKIEVDAQNRFVVTTEEGKTEVASAEILAERCLECKANFPVIYDLLSGEKTKRPLEKPFGSLEKIESLSAADRWSVWKEQLDRFTRSYARRPVSPRRHCR